MKNLILGIIVLGVLGACNSEPKDEVGRYELRSYDRYNDDYYYVIFDKKSGKITSFREIQSGRKVTELELNGMRKTTEYYDADTTYRITKTLLPYEKYAIQPEYPAVPEPVQIVDTTAAPVPVAE